jgi:hypothetical protein
MAYWSSHKELSKKSNTCDIQRLAVITKLTVFHQTFVILILEQWRYSRPLKKWSTVESGGKSSVVKEKDRKSGRSRLGLNCMVLPKIKNHLSIIESGATIKFFDDVLKAVYRGKYLTLKPFMLMTLRCMMSPSNFAYFHEEDTAIRQQKTFFPNYEEFLAITCVMIVVLTGNHN